MSLYITTADKEKLMKMIDKEKEKSVKTSAYANNLEKEIRKAAITDPGQLPVDVITMNTKVVLIMDDSEEEVTLVYPEEADFKLNKISVLSPIGTAILGYREGDIILWHIPNGSVRIIIKKVLYQPEASGKE